ncbi:DinB family protein [Ekhidna sp.]
MKEDINRKLKRLDDDTEKIFESIEDLSEDQLKNQTYGWSLVQVMSHLNEAEKASLKYMQKKVQAGDKMQNSRMGNKVRMWLTNLGLKSSLKWGAPSYISNPPEYDLNEIKEQWADTRKAIHSFVEEYPDKWLEKLVYKHPMAGRQNLNGAVDSFVYHQIHHIHQIKRIRKKMNS